MVGITGSKGVLGEIICSKLEEKKIEYSRYLYDVRNFQDFNDWVNSNNLTTIIHLASRVAIKEVDENIDLAYDVNVGGTINLIKILNNSPKKIDLFFSSSSHVYKSSDLPLKENDLLEPINSYGLTKYVSELLLLDFKNKRPDLKICIGRIFSFFHSTQKPPFLYPNLMERFRNEDLNKPFKVFGAYSTRDFSNADKICDIIYQLVEKRFDGIVNIASGKSTQVIDFVKEIAPNQLIFELIPDEKKTHLNADISLLNKILEIE